MRGGCRLLVMRMNKCLAHDGWVGHRIKSVARLALLTGCAFACIAPASEAAAQAQVGGVGAKAAALSRQHAVATPVPAASVHGHKPLVPASFDGKPREGGVIVSGSATEIDAAHAAVLKEDGLAEASTARYRGNGLVGWSLQVLRFGDATGAYSAYTFYRNPEMQPEAVGDNACASADTFLVQSNANLVLVRATGVDANTAAGDAQRLRSSMVALIADLPKLRGPEAVAPMLPGILPVDGLIKETVHYAIGPASYNGLLPVSVIDFSRDAEVVTGRYGVASGAPALLTLLMLPTPQIAHAEEVAINALPDASLHAGVRRIGPLVAVVSGPGMSAAAAAGLLAEVHYKAEISVDELPPSGAPGHAEIAKTAQLLLGIAMLTGVLALAAVVIAIFLGAGRVMVRRLRGKPDSSMNDDDFISLKI